MAKWKEIYATVKANYSGKEQDRSMYLCKVPTNSLFYSNNILKDICERLYDHIGGNGFTWNYVQYTPLHH